MNPKAGPSRAPCRDSQDLSPIDGYFQPGVIFNLRFSPPEESPRQPPAQGICVPARFSIHESVLADLASEMPYEREISYRAPIMPERPQKLSPWTQRPQNSHGDDSVPQLKVNEAAPAVLTSGLSGVPPADLPAMREPEPQPKPSPAPQGPQKPLPELPQQPRQSERKRPELTINTTMTPLVRATATPPLFTGTTAATSSTRPSTPQSQDQPPSALTAVSTAAASPAAAAGPSKTTVAGSSPAPDVTPPSAQLAKKNWESLVLQLPIQSEVELYCKRRYWLCEAEYRCAVDALTYWTERAEEGRKALRRGETGELLDLTEYQIAYRSAYDAFKEVENEMLKWAMQKLWLDGEVGDS